MLKKLTLFILTFLIGLSFINKPITQDEKYTQTEMSLSYGKIWQGKINEGCNSPLWYTIEKASGSVHMARVISVICIALAVSLIGWPGLLMLPLIWHHIAEARPYPLIVLLTTLLLCTKNPWWLLILALTDFITLPLILFSKFWWIAFMCILIYGYYWIVAPHYHFYFPWQKNIHGFYISRRYFIYLVPIAIINLRKLYENNT